MELLRTAVVDIITMVATCHALRSSSTAGESALQGKLRSRLRRNIKRGTVAYIDTLARTKRGVVDGALLAACRVAAEREMPHALAHQDLLGRIMAGEAGALDGMAAARQDLWRLANMAIHLRAGMATLQPSPIEADAQSARRVASRLRRRLRKALIAYARATLRARSPDPRPMEVARDAALRQIGPRGAADAERLADYEAGALPSQRVIAQGVSKPLLDLALDWQRGQPEPA